MEPGCAGRMLREWVWVPLLVPGCRERRPVCERKSFLLHALWYLKVHSHGYGMSEFPSVLMQHAKSASAVDLLSMPNMLCACTPYVWPSFIMLDRSSLAMHTPGP